ncbi:protein ENHANCED DOWNY MILDEW 2-like isoform X2 [Asparagus officinalis]|uniref:protein ENHANCED DOWNY MILDEW 2-like isoform X2 n=1 Tax=Asparagus officinalis TaxID=4686 RepID=UPI00098DF56F|nr:protein ENHANCED DOWNY MILDEW 2-like isoform X2 [Asparagus officinalis]
MASSSDEEVQDPQSVTDIYYVDDTENNVDDLESDADPICAICDDGGRIVRCEGRCRRSFHATIVDGIETGCNSLGLSEAQIQAIDTFLCKNCEYNQHQCFVCGSLGSSDMLAGAQVFPCVDATCGHFYHPKCVADLLFPENEMEATECELMIADGESFTCPAHKCHVCNQEENKEVPELQFAVCRRCPMSYHRQCLPGEIVLDGAQEGVIQRAWESLIPERILIYCLHEIDANLGTPRRNHIIFPEIPEGN